VIDGIEPLVGCRDDHGGDIAGALTWAASRASRMGFLASPREMTPADPRKGLLAARARRLGASSERRGDGWSVTTSHPPLDLHLVPDGGSRFRPIRTFIPLIRAKTQAILRTARDRLAPDTSDFSVPASRACP
jgi:hypothetical protein